MGVDKNYLKRVFYTFCPKVLFKLSPFKKRPRAHWKKQDSGDSHGYDKYDFAQEKRDVVLVEEVKSRISENESILDLGCNCGRDLYLHKGSGFSKLTGVDICQNAIEYGKKKFDLANVEMVAGGYEEVLPKFVAHGRKFDLIYSGGASISLVHPSFDIVKHMCALSNKYVLLLNEDNQDYAYSRFWECEFRRHGFMLVKYLRPAYKDRGNPDILSSLAVYRRV
ncbi:MAG: methyltransferase domain-containing protein [Candidatus Omnitrophica bacterium]|nr:methyltransferase domain-containing protein [Candidatus Omnitrophota bacterium]